MIAVAVVADRRRQVFLDKQGVAVDRGPIQLLLIGRDAVLSHVGRVTVTGAAGRGNIGGIGGRVWHGGVTNLVRGVTRHTGRHFLIVLLV